jgi:hypothetical protein
VGQRYLGVGWFTLRLSLNVGLSSAGLLDGWRVKSVAGAICHQCGSIDVWYGSSDLTGREASMMRPLAASRCGIHRVIDYGSYTRPGNPLPATGQPAAGGRAGHGGSLLWSGTSACQLSVSTSVGAPRILLLGEAVPQTRQ